MKFGSIDIPRYRIDSLCRATVVAFLEDMNERPDVRDRVLARAEQIRAERERKEIDHDTALRT